MIFSLSSPRHLNDHLKDNNSEYNNNDDVDSNNNNNNNNSSNNNNRRLSRNFARIGYEED